MSTNGKNDFHDIVSWQDLKSIIQDPSMQAAYRYLYSMAQQMNITISVSPRNERLMLAKDGTGSAQFDANYEETVEAIAQTVEFFVDVQKANQPTLTEQVQQLQQEVSRLREAIETSVSTQSSVEDLDNASWAEFVSILRQEAQAAGGDIEVFGRKAVCYFRCARLKLRSLFSPILMKPPYHSGQKHHIRFALPQDVELMRSCFRHDAVLYKAMQTVTDEAPETQPDT